MSASVASIAATLALGVNPSACTTGGANSSVWRAAGSQVRFPLAELTGAGYPGTLSGL